MKCPVCGRSDSKVVETRAVEDNSSIRRRRVCVSCGYRFTTFEVVEAQQLVVVKKNGSKELFDRSKLLVGIMKATEKRPVDADLIVKLIEAELYNSLRQEVTTVEIGELVMEKLKAADEVAYVRFASVYREFKDVDSFLSELKSLKKKTPGRKKKTDSPVS